jgi:hypothetical protein
LRALLQDRKLTGSALGGAGLFGTFFLTYYLQQTLGYSPLVTGIAFLPISVGSAIAPNLRRRPQPVQVSGSPGR